EKGLTSYGDRGFSLFLRKAFIKGAGYTDDALSRPVVGIINTGSAYNPCHGNTTQLIEAIRRGVMLSGGLPIDFPTISIHESFAHPTSMYLRNLMSMDTEEMIRAQPMDAVVLIGGCDKTVPAPLMGAASANVPCVQLVTGSMLTGSHEFERVGACTDCRRFWGRYRAEEIDAEEISRVNNQLVASVGTCSVMGTASTMACIAEALGIMLPGGASPPAVTADRIRIAEQTGATAVQMANNRLTPDQILTGKAFENALRVLLAIGGSTNGIIHLTAIAGRLGIEIDLDRLDDIGHDTPAGAIIKQSAADPQLMEHEGRAVVFENVQDMAERIDDDALDVNADDILVLKNIGPKGAPGMPEAGYLPIPKKLGRAGVKDMVRISDGRMSGTAAGTIVLHVTPESAIGGPLAWVKSGDRIRLDVEARKLELLVSDEEMARRRARQPVEAPRAARGYLKRFLDTVTQADQGVDFDFLRKR